MAESERRHFRSSFGQSDQLLTVLPNGQPTTVEIHDAHRLEVQNEFEFRSVFAGPIVRFDAPNYKLFYQCKKWSKCTENIVEEDRDSFELIGNYLEHHIKQNGVIVRKNVIDLILKGHEPKTTTENSDEEGSDDSVNEVFTRGLEEIDRPFTVNRSMLSLEKLTDHFIYLLMYGQKEDALEWAVKSGLWGHACLLAHFMGQQTQAYVITRFDSTGFQENSASHRFYQLPNTSPQAIDDALDWAIENNLWGHAFSLAYKVDKMDKMDKKNKNKKYKDVMTRFLNLRIPVNGPLQTFFQMISGSDVNEMGKGKLNKWRSHLAMILSNQTQQIDRDRKLIRSIGDSLELEGKIHGCNFCYLMTEMIYSSPDNFKICLSASSNSRVLKLIDIKKHVEHTYSLMPESAERIPARHQELITRMPVNQRNQYGPKVISEDILLQLYNQQEDYILSKDITSPEVLQTCNGICQQLKKENRNFMDVQAYYFYDKNLNRYCIMYGILCMGASVKIKHIRYFLVTFEDNGRVSCVPYSKVNNFLSYMNRKQKTDFIHCIQKHYLKLLKNHLNLEHISTSPFKEVKGEFINEACIVLHISKKGLIPLGQTNLPKALEYSGKYFPVDVRSPVSSIEYRADDFFQTLRMGCQVYSPIADGFFTLGGFVIGSNKNISFVVCAHSVLMEETVREMKECGNCIHEADVESHEVCFQPVHQSKFLCGRLTKAVFKPGTDTETGVDCALVQCCSKRQPACGYFPDLPGVFKPNNVNNIRQSCTSSVSKEKFITGEMLDSDQIPENSTVYKFGIKNGWTEGTLDCKGDSELKFRGSDFKVCMHGQYKVCNKDDIDDRPFALEGDSGAWVFLRDRDSRLKVIGMVIGIEENVTTVTPISAILKSLDLQKESIMALNGSDSNDLDSFEEDDAQNPPCKLHYINEEVRKVRKVRKPIPNPDVVNVFGILG